MAKQKQIGAVGLLPDRRAVRVIKMDSERMLDLMERVGAHLPVVKPGDANAVDGKVQAKISKETQKATIAMCVKGITLRPVEIKSKMRAPTAEEIEKATAAGEPAPTEVADGVDFNATLGDLATNPSDPRWTSLGEQQLDNFSEENELSMFRLFDDPTAWKAVLARISEAGGGAGIIDPFAGKLLRTSAGS